VANGIIGAIDIARSIDQKKPLGLLGHGVGLLDLKVAVIIPQDDGEAKRRDQNANDSGIIKDIACASLVLEPF
jgi:hypothetical protein